MFEEIAQRDVLRMLPWLFLVHLSSRNTKFCELDRANESSMMILNEVCDYY